MQEVYLVWCVRKDGSHELSGVWGNESSADEVRERLERLNYFTKVYIQRETILE